MAERECRKYSITGRVQGVFFRASTAEVARDLGLVGYAVNLPDGSVEVLACGAEDKIEVLQKWLNHGPPMAQVEHVDCQPVDDPAPSGFTTG